MIRFRTKYFFVVTYIANVPTKMCAEAFGKELIIESLIVLRNCGEAIVECSDKDTKCLLHLPRRITVILHQHNILLSYTTIVRTRHQRHLLPSYRQWSCPFYQKIVMKIYYERYYY